MKRSARALGWCLFVYYLLLLCWIILYKLCFSFAELDRLRTVNLIPFAQSTYPNGRVNVSEIINNVLICIPFGVYLSVLCAKWSVFQRLLPIFLTSLAFETLQYAFSIGVSDVTDLMGNTLGGGIGIALHALTVRLCKSRARADRLMLVLACVGSACCTALIALLLLGG